MITFIQAIILSKIPPVPTNIGPPGLPSLPIDDGIIFLLFSAIVLGTYMYYKKTRKKEKVNNKSSLI